MKVLVYVNLEKDSDKLILNSITNCLQKYNIKHDVVDDIDFNLASNCKYDALFIIGGDGTILGRTEVSNIHNIPIIGVNAGKLGFLTEFEYKEVENAVKLLSENQLVIDKRVTIKVVFNGKTYYALNDVLVQRVNSYDESCSTTTLKISVDEHDIDTIRGDGVIVSTPTGSTAYSLSAGGAILAPGINAFIITPVCAHSFTNRPVVYSNDSTSSIKFISGTKPGVFIDGKFIGILEQNYELTIVKAENTTNFLRKKDYNFYKRLSLKLKNGKVKENE